MKYRLRAYSIWDCGKRVDAEGKPHQEDSLFPAHNKATASDRLFILCDGMGGHDAGEVASATVCEAMSKSILSAHQDAEGAFSEEDFNKALADAFAALDAKDDGTSVKKMGTTMTLLKLHNGGDLIAHIGDSRVYHIRPGKTREETRIIFRTEDHSLVNELVKAGELTPEEARFSKQRNVITRAMQPHAEQRPKADIHTSGDIQPGDYFYLCSDGMLENMEDEQLCYFFSQEAGDDQRKVESLLKATRENRDNHSAILVHVLDVINPRQNHRGNAQFSTDNKFLYGVRNGSPYPSIMRTRPRKPNSRIRIWITALILALVAVLAVWCWLSLSAPKPKADKVEQTSGIKTITKPQRTIK